MMQLLTHKEVVADHRIHQRLDLGDQPVPLRTHEETERANHYESQSFRCASGAPIIHNDDIGNQSQSQCDRSSFPGPKASQEHRHIFDVSRLKLDW
jgi:hypothetical protein